MAIKNLIITLTQRFIGKILISFLIISGLSGCVADHVTTEISNRPELTFPIPISVIPCFDRTETKVADLGEQATTTFEETLNATKEFTVVSDGDFTIVTCPRYQIIKALTVIGRKCFFIHSSINPYVLFL